jgi:hypothetical protein
VRPDFYLIVPAGELLHAPTLAELAEIAECAIAEEIGSSCCALVRQAVGGR